MTIQQRTEFLLNELQNAPKSQWHNVINKFIKTLKQFHTLATVRNYLTTFRKSALDVYKNDLDSMERISKHLVLDAKSQKEIEIQKAKNQTQIHKQVLLVATKFGDNNIGTKGGRKEQKETHEKVES